MRTSASTDSLPVQPQKKLHSLVIERILLGIPDLAVGDFEHQHFTVVGARPWDPRESPSWQGSHMQTEKPLPGSEPPADTWEGLPEPCQKVMIGSGCWPHRPRRNRRLHR